MTLLTRCALSFLEWEATGNILWTKYETEDSSFALFPGIDIDNDDCKIDISWYNHLSFICINIFTSRERSISTCYSNCPNATESQRLTESVLVVQIKTLPNFLQWTNCFGEFRYQMNESYINISNGKQTPHDSHFLRYFMWKIMAL